MATLFVWISVCTTAAIIGALALTASIQYFVLGESKEEVISNMKDLL